MASAEFWWRSWHGAPIDHKWSAISARSGSKAGVVSAVAWALLDYASQHQDRGTVAGFDTETYSIYSGFDEAEVIAIIQAMTDKGMIVDGRWASWEKRQPKSEREIQRATENREKKRAVTESSKMLQNVTEKYIDTDTDAESDNTGATPESDPDQEEDVKKFSDPMWDLMHGQDVTEPARQGIDLDWVPADIGDMARAFITATNLPAPTRKTDRGYWIKSLRDMRLGGLCARDITRGVEKMREDGLTIKSPQSVQAVAANLKAAGAKLNGRANHPLPNGV
jgi:hypothetical protein